MEQLKQKELTKEAKKLFIELEKSEPKFSDKNTLALIKKAIQRGYELGYNKFHVSMCDKCKYRSATCFGVGEFCGTFCEECAMEERAEDE